MGAGFGLFALGDVARQRNEAPALPWQGALLAGNRQLEPVEFLTQLEPILVPGRIAGVAGGLQRRPAARCRFGRHQFHQAMSEEGFRRHLQQPRTCRPEMQDAPVRVELEQQVGNGVEGAFEVVPGAAQRPGHVVRQCHCALAPGGQNPGHAPHQQAQGHAQNGNEVLPAVVKPPLERRQGLHGQRPGTAPQLHLTQLAQFGAGGRVAVVQQLVGQRLLAIVDGQMDVGVDLLGHALQQVAHAEGRRNPAQNARPAAFHGVGIRTGGIDGQIHHQADRGGFATVLPQRQCRCHGQFPRIPRTLQGVAGRRYGADVEAQGLEVVVGLRFDVRNGGVLRTRPFGMHAIHREPLGAHGLLVGVQFAGGQSQDIGHALQSGQGFLQPQRLHIGVELGPVDAFGAIVIPLHPAQHDLVGVHPFPQAVGDAVHGGGECLAAPVSGFLHFTQPVQQRETEQQKRQQRSGQHRPSVMSQRRLGGVKAGGGRHRQRQRPAGPVLHPTPERGEDDGTHGATPLWTVRRHLAMKICWHHRNRAHLRYTRRHCPVIPFFQKAPHAIA